MIYGSQHCAGTHSAHPVLFFFVACTVQVVVIAHAFDMVHAGDTVHAVDTEPLRLCPEMRR